MAEWFPHTPPPLRIIRREGDCYRSAARLLQAWPASTRGMLWLRGHNLAFEGDGKPGFEADIRTASIRWPGSGMTVDKDADSARFDFNVSTNPDGRGWNAPQLADEWKRIIEAVRAGQEP